MLRNVNETENRAFWYIIKQKCGAMNDFPVSSKEVAMHIGCSRYAALKALHTLCGMGLIERRSVGIPAFEGSGEYHDDWYDAQPPKNGYDLTKKGAATTEFRQADRILTEEYARWAEGRYNEE